MGRAWSRLWARRRELPGVVVLVAFLMVGFDQLNALAPMRTAAALAHGRSVLHVEHVIGISLEGPASRWLVAHHGLALIANWAYNTCQICVTLAVIGWLWWRHGDAWRSLRWVVLGTNLVAILVFWTYPVAPPRLVNGSGVVDAIAVVPVPFGWAPGIQPHVPDQFQALPSLHLAWASWITVSVWVVSRRRSARMLAAAYPAFVGVVVVVTGAHSVTDIVAGVATTAVLAGARASILSRRRPAAGYPAAIRDGISSWTSASSPSHSKAQPTTIS